MKSGRGTAKLQSVEIVRVFASLSVILWHYQFFFFTPAESNRAAFRTTLPLAHGLSLFYNYGFYAVQWFWVLSGYIFFFTYRDMIETRATNGTMFFSRRIARLYPLHLVTLLVVTFLLIVYTRLFHSTYWVYKNGSNLDFVLQLFMASNWISTKFTYNAPIWSVSVEVLIYILFFIMAAYLPIKKIAKTALVLIVSAALFFIATRFKHGGTAIWITRCAVCFYLGGMVYELQTRYSVFGLGLVKNVLIWTVVGLAVIVCFFIHPSSAQSFALPAAIILFIVSNDIIERSRFVSRISWMGNMTYSSYLLHYPIALSIIIVLHLLKMSLHIAYSPIFLFGYIIVVYSLAELSYKFFETPARRMLTGLAIRFSRSRQGGLVIQPLHLGGSSAQGKSVDGS